MKLEKVNYRDLNSRQQESYNYQKVSGILAEYGFTTIRLTDDWEGADFLARHVSGETLRVQLKGRLVVLDKYSGKDIWIAFPHKGQWFLYPHDEFAGWAKTNTKITGTRSWPTGGYTWPHPSRQLLAWLAPYRIGEDGK